MTHQDPVLTQRHRIPRRLSTQGGQVSRLGALPQHDKPINIAAIGAKTMYVDNVTVTAG